MDANPVSKGHVLIVPKYHATRLHDIDDNFLTDILPVAKRLAKAQNLHTNTDTGYNILQNNGKIASQAVDHVHFHFIPKTDTKTGLQIGWPSQPADPDTLQRQHREIEEALLNN